MKLTCQQADLSRGLAIVGRAVPTRTTLPITNNVLLSTDQHRLKLVATNLEMAISYWITANKVEEEGAITVPARLLTEFVNSLPSQEKDTHGELQTATIRLDLPSKGKVLSAKCARFEAKISGIDAKDFPPVPVVGEGITTRVEVDALRLGIGQVVFAAATEESRPVLTGVDARFEDGLVTLAAADGFRLAVHKLPLQGTIKDKTEVIIPARTMAELNRLMSDGEELVDITVNPNKSQILFHLKDLQLVSQLVQGTFPQHSQLIPQSYKTRAVVSKEEFLRATKTASIFARDGSGIVKVIISGAGNPGQGIMTISARSEELGENEGTIDAKVDGPEAKIAFNGKYLTDVLGVIPEDEVALETTGPSSPGVIRPVDKDSNTVDKYVHVVMPMFVQW